MLGARIPKYVNTTKGELRSLRTGIGVASIYSVLILIRGSVKAGLGGIRKSENRHLCREAYVLNYVRLLRLTLSLFQSKQLFIRFPKYPAFTIGYKA